MDPDIIYDRFIGEEFPVHSVQDNQYFIHLQEMYTHPVYICTRVLYYLLGKCDYTHVDSTIHLETGYHERIYPTSLVRDSV